MQTVAPPSITSQSRIINSSPTSTIIRTCPIGSSLNKTSNGSLQYPKLSETACIGADGRLNYTPKCGPGFTLNSTTSKCERDSQPFCVNLNTKFDSNLNKCIWNFDCPTGTSFDKTIGKCAADFTCPNGSYFNDITGDCVVDSGCPVGTLDIATRKCIENVACIDGTTLDTPAATCSSPSDIICKQGGIKNMVTGKCEQKPGYSSCAGVEDSTGCKVYSTACPSSSPYIYSSSIPTVAGTSLTSGSTVSNYKCVS